MANYGSINDAVDALIQQQVADGRQIGVQVCAYKDGMVVVDACAGHMGPNDSRSVQADSLFLSFSMTKGVAATAVHILADKGLLEYDAPVARYWHEFAANGKEKITVAQAMSHQAGLHAMPTPFKLEHLTDWEAGIHWIEQGVPAWEPGTAVGYHGVTFSWIVGGIVAAVTGRHIKDVIRSEIAQPLGMADEMFVGIPDGVEDRLTTLAIWNFDQIMKERGLTLSRESDTLKAMPLELWQHCNSMAVRKACLPAANGHFSARALAKMYAALSVDGSIQGIRLVSPERIAAMQRLEVEGMDRVTGTVSRKGIGFFLGGIINGIYGPMGPHSTAFGHGGAGGSIGFADPEARLAIAVTLNKMEFAVPGQGRAQEICDLIRQELAS
jgi:CubicO group peptidase (beta-lactamase class C family)